MKDKVVVAWSGGKDAAQALYELIWQDTIEVASLLTTITESYDRISMHGVRRSLLEQQAEALGYALEKISIPQSCSNEIYEERMRLSLEKFGQQGVTAVAFGDLFLQDIRAYREERMRRTGMHCLFPLWGKPTPETARRFLDLGFRAIVVCVDTKVLDGAFAGRDYDRDFIKNLPPGVDPCGENGEFHTFVYDGPIFKKPVPVQRGDIVLRDERFFYCDLK
ncbi:MAG: diphthine--ammonia ligase [Acidobacteriota bacterium]|nr:diphthine--ammonia ligase [Acidobacteriota bacterium]